MVVGGEPSNLDQVIEINKGSRDGIVPGLGGDRRRRSGRQDHHAVLPDRSYVMLLTDSRYAVGVKVVPGAPDPTTTTIAPPPSDGVVPPGSEVPSTGETTPVTSTSIPTSIPASTAPPTSPPETTTSSSTTTTLDVTNSRDTGQLRGQGAERLPQVDLLADTPVFGRFVPGDIVLTSGGTDGLAPPDIPIGVVRNVINRSSAEGPLLEVQQLADLDRLHFVRIVLYKPESEIEQPIDTQAGG